MADAGDGSGEAEASARLRRKRRRSFKLVALAVLVVGTEVGAALALALKPRPFGARVLRLATDFEEQAQLLRTFAEQPDADAVFGHDPELGWTVRRGVATDRDTITSQGLRASRDYALQPPADTLRVAAFGDSFVYCTEVPTPDSWPAQIERAHPKVEVLNYGVAAYGPDQGLMRYRAEGQALMPHVALLSVAPPNIWRVVNRYRHFLFRNPTELGCKPRFVLEGDSLTYLPSPLRTREAATEHALDVDAFVRDVGQQDRFYEPAIYENPLYDWSATVRLLAAGWVYYRHRLAPDGELTGGSGAGVFNPESEAFKVMGQVFLTFAAEARARGVRPAILVMPTQDSVERVAAGGVGVCDPMVGFCREQGLDVLDANDAFAGAAGGVDAWFMPHGHYSPAGNLVVAEWLAGELPGLAE